MQDIVDVSRFSSVCLWHWSWMLRYWTTYKTWAIAFQWCCLVSLTSGLHRRSCEIYQTNSKASRKTCASDVIGSSAKLPQIYMRCAATGESCMRVVKRSLTSVYLPQGPQFQFSRWFGERLCRSPSAKHTGLGGRQEDQSRDLSAYQPQNQGPWPWLCFQETAETPVLYPHPWQPIEAQLTQEVSPSQIVPWNFCVLHCSRWLHPSICHILVTYTACTLKENR
jgi:hypothetical protein